MKRAIVIVLVLGSVAFLPPSIAEAEAIIDVAPTEGAVGNDADSVTLILNVPYATVTALDGKPLALPLDVYIPPASLGRSSFPSVLVVHGAITTGDKAKFAAQGTTFAEDGFVAFVANYRMSCDPDSPPPGVDPRLCGFHAPAPTNDLQLAMHWIRGNATTYEGNPAEVGAHGASFGGSLVAYLGVTGIPADTRPDVVTSWSGPMELWLYYLSPQAPGVYTAIKAYTGVSCNEEVTPPDCPAKWHIHSAASPGQTHDPVLPSDGAPMYLANSTMEKVPLPMADDMLSELQAAHGSGVDQLTVLEGAKHASQYRNDVDPVTGLTVFAETLAFQHRYLG